MILPIAVYGHPVLRQVAKAVQPDYPNLQQFIKDLWATMYRTDGIGLAAPQVARSIRIFVIDLDVFKDEYPELKGFKKAFINPQIEYLSSKKVWLTEGCLSVPGIHRKVKRPGKIRISYQDENFNPVVEEYQGFAARVIQHEFDHLEGVLFVDYLNCVSRSLIRIELTRIKRGKLNTNYRILLP